MATTDWMLKTLGSLITAPKYTADQIAWAKHVESEGDDRIGKYRVVAVNQYDDQYETTMRHFSTRERAVEYASIASSLWMPGMYWVVFNIEKSPVNHGVAQYGIFRWAANIKKGYDQ